MIKAKKYDWKDSNLAMFKADSKAEKETSAEYEPAWKGAGTKPGLKIWRINKFKVTDWPKDQYGEFYSGDSYIILNTYTEKNGGPLEYDIHFWIGKYSTQDEYGTAAYKTVQLDTYLKEAAVQHREIQNNESALFKSYFPELVLMKGGAASGFKKLQLTPDYIRLFVFEKITPKNVQIRQISAKKGNVKSSNVYILDRGTSLVQWNGKTCDKDEKLKAQQFIQKLKGERCGKVKQTEIIEEGNRAKEEMFFSFLRDGSVKEKPTKVSSDKKKLFRVSDKSGKQEWTLVSEGSEIKRSQLDSKDVFIVDVCDSVFVWIGKNASRGEKKNCVGYAHSYLQSTKNPFLPISVVSEGKLNSEFTKATVA